MVLKMVDRGTFLTSAMSKEGSPYIWGAKGPDQFDCSGLVTWCLRQAGFTDWRSLFAPKDIVDSKITSVNWYKFVSAQRLWDRLPVASKPGAADLAFYGSGPSHITHVMIVTGDGRVLGASGGGMATTSVTPNAKVKFKPSPAYRFDLRGYRSIT